MIRFTERTPTMKYFAALLGIAAGIVAAGLAQAQAPQDFSKIEIKSTKVTNSFYTLEGSGGTIGVLAGPDGILMVDDEYAQLSDKIVAAIKKISPNPIRFLINTHVHGDHTGGNENFGKMGAVLVSRDELRFRLAHPNPAANGTPGTPMAPAGLSLLTYEGHLTFHMNGEEVQAIAIPQAHTDGDTLVYFPNNDVIMTGDFYRSIGYPNIDRANGGSLKGMLDGLGMVIGMRGRRQRLFPATEKRSIATALPPIAT